MTKEGISCQRWDSQYPHGHSYDNDILFPFDGTATAAANYCRDPDGTFMPWCYTVDPDPDKRRGFCDIPLCDGKEHYNP